MSKTNQIAISESCIYTLSKWRDEATDSWVMRQEESHSYRRLENIGHFNTMYTCVRLTRHAGSLSHRSESVYLP